MSSDISVRKHQLNWCTDGAPEPSKRARSDWDTVRGQEQPSKRARSVWDTDRGQEQPSKRARSVWDTDRGQEQPSKRARSDLLNLPVFPKDNYLTSATTVTSSERKPWNQALRPRHARMVQVKLNEKDTVLANVIEEDKTSKRRKQQQCPAQTPLAPKLFSRIQFSTHFLIDRVRSKLNFLSERQRMSPGEPFFRQKWDGDAVTVSFVPSTKSSFNKMPKQRLPQHIASNGTSSRYDGIPTPAIKDIMTGWSLVYPNQVYGPILNWNNDYRD